MEGCIGCIITQLQFCRVRLNCLSCKPIIKVKRVNQIINVSAGMFMHVTEINPPPPIPPPPVLLSMESDLQCLYIAT